MYRSIICIMILSLTAHFSCDKKPHEKILVMTFNIRYGTANDGINSWEQRKKILAACLKKNRPDILCVQEALDFQIEYIKTVLPKFVSFGVGRYHGVSQPTRPHESMKGESCNILYDSTRFSLINRETYWHSDTPDIPASMTWGNSLPRITTWGHFKSKKDSREFIVMNTHFHWGEPYVTNTAKLIMRKWRQIASDTPTILAGDFNLEPGSRTHQLFCSQSGSADLQGTFVDCWQTLGHSDIDAGTSHDYTGVKNKARIDWILATKQFESKDIRIVYYNKDGRYPSDHFPVLAELNYLTN